MHSNEKGEFFFRRNQPDQSSSVSCIGRQYNMARSVENPFKKEGRPKWVYYAGTIGIVSLLIFVFIFGGAGTETLTTNNGSSLLKSKTVIDAKKTENIKPPPENKIQQIDRLKQLRGEDDAAADGIVKDKGEDDDDGDGDGDNEEEEEEEEENGDDQEGENEDENGDDQEEDESESESEDDEDVDEDDDVDKEVFPLLKQDEYLQWLRGYYQSLKFKTHEDYHINDKKLNPDMLLKSLRMGCDYIVENQIKDVGNFNYQYNFVTKQMDTSDSPVRQVGALWGLTLCFNRHPTNIRYKKAIEKSFKFFRTHMIDGPIEDSRMIKYPDFDESQSGVNALYGLAIIDYMRTMYDYDMTHVHDVDIPIEELKLQLKGTIKFLKYMQNDDLHFSKEYNFMDQAKSKESSSYYDGETMLCLMKAVKYMDGYDNLIPRIEKAAPIMAKAYTVDAWRKDGHDSDETKGFYQWSSMFFTEYYLAKLDNYEYYGDYVIVLAHWIIHTHGILKRKRNTGYAFEGIISAFEIAESRGHEDALLDLGYTIDEGLYKLGGYVIRYSLYLQCREMYIASHCSFLHLSFDWFITVSFGFAQTFSFSH
jgi:hypothetical protein